MISTKNIYSIICFTLLFGCDNKDDNVSSPVHPAGSFQGEGETKESNSPKDSRHTKKAGRIAKSEAEQALGKFASDWENMAGQNKGQATLEKQKELALALLPKLGGSDELLKFLDYLTERGAGDLRKELIEKHLGVIFTDPHAAEAREWLLTVEDKQLREQLCRLAGEAFSGIGFKDYFELMGQYGGLNSQAALLYGYCVTMAKSDPDAAVNVYKDLGYPKRIDNTGMADVMAAMPPGTDFMKFATGIKEDSMTLAKRSRAALLRNWAGVKPQEAAQYVLSNSATGVHPDQMAEVMTAWAKTSPSSAGEWLANAPAGKPKDEGTAAMAGYWSGSDPIKAWEFASKVGDFKKRVETATVVFKEWEKTDKTAATNAWVALFPGSQ